MKDNSIKVIETQPIFAKTSLVEAVAVNMVQPVEQLADQVKQKSSLLTKLVCGAIAGVTGTCIIYPLGELKLNITYLTDRSLDIVKTRMQNQTKLAIAGDTGVRYKNGLDCFRTIIKAEGVRGLYRGLPANLIGITPEKAIKLAVNDYAREYLANRHHVSLVKTLGRENAPKYADADSLPIPLGMLAGSTAGFCQVIATNPMEIVKINSQMAGQIALKTGTVAKTSSQIVRELGLRGMYRGTPSTLLRDVPFSFIFFPASSYFKQLARDEHGKVSFGAVFWSGIGAGILAAGSVTPADGTIYRFQ